MKWMLQQTKTYLFINGLFEIYVKKGYKCERDKVAVVKYSCLGEVDVIDCGKLGEVD